MRKTCSCSIVETKTPDRWSAGYVCGCDDENKLRSMNGEAIPTGFEKLRRQVDDLTIQIDAFAKAVAS